MKMHWRPRPAPRPSLTLFWLRGRQRPCRNSRSGARRRIYVGLPDPKFYPAGSPPVMKLERFEGELHRIVLRGLFAAVRKGKRHES